MNIEVDTADIRRIKILLKDKTYRTTHVIVGEINYMNYIFIDSKDGIEKVGIVEENKLVEFYIDHDDKDQLVGNIYRAGL